MKFPHRVYIATVIGVALFAFIGTPHAHSKPLPDDSYYQLNAPLETHRGEHATFAEHAGEPVIVSMFYASCPHVCPMLISTIRQIEKQLPEAVRDDVNVLLVSVDPDRDTPAELRELAERHDVNRDGWTLARTSGQQTRALAAVLGIKYKQLPDGEFNHTTEIILLDAQGREIARSNRLGAPDPAFVKKVEEAFSK